MSEMEELLDRVKAATGPDRELDEAVALITSSEHEFAQLADAPIGTGCMMYRHGVSQMQSALRVTSSIDAALALSEILLPEYRFAMYTDGGGKGPTCLSMYDNDPVSAECRAPTLPLAIISALLTTLMDKVPK